MKLPSRTQDTGTPGLTQLETCCVTLGLSFPTCATERVEFIISKVLSNPIIPLLLLRDAGKCSRQAACRLLSPGKLIQSSMLQSINYWPICFRNIKGTFINCIFHSTLQRKDLGAFGCLSYLKPQLESISPSLHGREHHFRGREGLP